MTQSDMANHTRVAPLFLSHCLSWVCSSSQPTSTMGLTELGPIIGADWQRKPHIKMDCHLSQTQQSWNTPGNARTREREDEVYGKRWEQRMSWEERIRERVRSSNETSAAEMFSNAISTSQTNYWRQKLRRTGKSGPWSDSTHYESEATGKPLEWVPALTLKMADEKREVMTEGTHKTKENYGGGSEEKRGLYIIGRRWKGFENLSLNWGRKKDDSNNRKTDH